MSRLSEVQIVCTRDMKSQAAWWVRNLFVKSLVNDPIPSAKTMLPMPSLELFPDAAGVNPDNPALGCGVFVDILEPIIFYMMWPDSIRLNKDTGYGKLGLKLSFLEGVAALCAVLAEPKLMFSKVVTIHSDNLGFVLAFRKGSSRCLLTYTIVMALKKLEAAFHMKLIVAKVPRCSVPQAMVADMLSKGLLQQVWSLFPHRRSQPGSHSSSLLHWLSNPYPTRVLGSAIMEELGEKYNIVKPEFEWDDEVLPLVKLNHNI